MKTIPEQLTDIYFRHEHWHAFKMPRKQAIRYHAKRVDSGEILVYLENGEVLGYCERHFVYNVCFFDNAWIKEDCRDRSGKVFKGLYRQFWNTLPDCITQIFWEREETVFRKAKISNLRRNHGTDKS